MSMLKKCDSKQQNGSVHREVCRSSMHEGLTISTLQRGPPVTTTEPLPGRCGERAGGHKTCSGPRQTALTNGKRSASRWVCSTRDPRRRRADAEAVCTPRCAGHGGRQPRRHGHPRRGPCGHGPPSALHPRPRATALPGVGPPRRMAARSRPRRPPEPSTALNRPPASSAGSGRRCGERQNLSGGVRGNGYIPVFYFLYFNMIITGYFVF